MFFPLPRTVQSVETNVTGFMYNFKFYYKGVIDKGTSIDGVNFALDTHLIDATTLQSFDDVTIPNQ